MIISDGDVIDGTGTAARRADVAIAGGKVVEIGEVEGSAHQVIDAEGLLVAPGIVVLHTHYDAQVLWDPACTPSGQSFDQTGIPHTNSRSAVAALRAASSSPALAFARWASKSAREAKISKQKNTSGSSTERLSVNSSVFSSPLTWAKTASYPFTRSSPRPGCARARTRTANFSVGPSVVAVMLLLRFG